MFPKLELFDQPQNFESSMKDTLDCLSFDKDSKNL